ncbi:MAG: histidinol dehydrogenase, partial [Alphaproteobacteria bacterium]
MPLRLSASAPGFEADFAAFIDRRRDAEEDVAGIVAGIIADVRKRGDAAVADYTKKFDRLDVSDGLRLDPDLIASARDACPAEQIEALELAADRIRAFHERQLPDG